MRELNRIIYALIDPVSHQIKYIGKSKKGLKRCRQHAQRWQLKARTPKNSWIKSLLKRGLTYDFEVIEVVPEHESLDDAECFYIAYFKSIGANLLNSTPGGEGGVGRRHEPEIYEKISSIMRNHWADDEKRQRYSARMKALWADPAFREERAQTMRGVKKSRKWSQ